MATASCELTWLKYKSLGVHHSTPMFLLSDSQATLHITAKPIFHECTKHTRLIVIFLYQIQVDNIATFHVHTNLQLAYIFTKALGK
uniref:Uncharacterized protein n=1 Tax=Cajanus cajan TaxID=3821 RepID=A0A151TTL9_CAJCA|nr:hypothetical protein KK1_009639 [Cajanus cajan]